MPIRDKKSVRYDKLVRLGKRGRVVKRITAGLHAKEGAKRYPTGVSVAELGSWHEFGLGVPQRSFIRGWFDENRAKLPAAIRAELQRAVKRGETQMFGLRRLAVTIQASIQARIANGIAPENADSTILRKGSATPLIDTGTLRSSIVVRVDGEKVA